MRLILFDRQTDSRINFDPIALCRPIWELRCGMTSLGDKLIAKCDANDVVGFVPDYMADVYREQSGWTINSAASLLGEDLLLVNARVKADTFDIAATGASQVAFDENGDCLFARIVKDDLGKLITDSLDGLIESAREAFPHYDGKIPTWNYTWDLILSNPDQITKDFSAAGRSGNDGHVDEPLAIRGSRSDVYIGQDASIHPMVVI